MFVRDYEKPGCQGVRVGEPLGGLTFLDVWLPPRHCGGYIFQSYPGRSLQGSPKTQECRTWYMEQVDGGGGGGGCLLSRWPEFNIHPIRVRRGGRAEPRDRETGSTPKHRFSSPGTKFVERKRRPPYFENSDLIYHFYHFFFPFGIKFTCNERVVLLFYFSATEDEYRPKGTGVTFFTRNSNPVHIGGMRELVPGAR